MPTQIPQQTEMPRQRCQPQSRATTGIAFQYFCLQTAGGHAIAGETVCACAVFIGLAMGLCAFLVDVALETLNNWKFGAVKSVIRDRGGFWQPYLTFLAFCLAYSGQHPSHAYPLVSIQALGQSDRQLLGKPTCLHVQALDICGCIHAGISGAIVSFAAPMAAGSGIPEIKTYLNGVHVRGGHRTKCIIARMELMTAFLESLLTQITSKKILLAVSLVPHALHGMQACSA